MKIDPQSVYIGMGAVSVIAAGLGVCRSRLARIFAVCLAAFLVFELLCVVGELEVLEPIWWLVHMPSTLALGVDEILERHGAVVSVLFHLGDFFLWSALITGSFWFRDRKRRCEVVS